VVKSALGSGHTSESCGHATLLYQAMHSLVQAWAGLQGCETPVTTTACGKPWSQCPMWKTSELLGTCYWVSWEEVSDKCTHGLSNLDVLEENVLAEAGGAGIALPWAALCLMEVQSPPCTSLSEMSHVWGGPHHIYLRVQEPLASELSPSRCTH